MVIALTVSAQQPLQPAVQTFSLQGAANHNTAGWGVELHQGQDEDEDYSEESKNTNMAP